MSADRGDLHHRVEGTSMTITGIISAIIIGLVIGANLYARPGGARR